MSDNEPPRLQLPDGAAVWSGGNPRGPFDLWLLPGAGDCHLRFSAAFESSIAARGRLHVWNLPGHGVSPIPSDDGLTVAHAASLLQELVMNVSGDRPVIMLAHRVAAVVASLAATLLESPPKLMISVQGNLTSSDAGCCRRAVRFQSPAAYRAWLERGPAVTARADAASGLDALPEMRADPGTFWSICRSLLAYRNAGDIYLRLPCPTIYYWDPRSTPRSTERFLTRHRPLQRQLSGLGEYPMADAPETFYRIVEDDIDRLVPDLRSAHSQRPGKPDRPDRPAGHGS